MPVLVLWIGLLPLLYRLTGRTNFQYRCPLLVLLFTFGIYSSQGTALFYAQGLRMPERMSNIIYFNAYPAPGRGFNTLGSARAREEVLRKLLLLAPGRYQFTARQTKTSSSEGSSAVWTLTCADGPLRSTKLFETGDTGTEVEIPASCKAQYLGLTVNGGTDSTGTELMVDEVRLRRL